MRAIRSWWKMGVIALALAALSGCSLIHSEIGEILDEEKSWSEYWQTTYPGHETGNRNRYKGRK